MGVTEIIGNRGKNQQRPNHQIPTVASAFFGHQKDLGS
jgi:hypothetical protein